MFYEKHIFVCENERAEGERPSCGKQGSKEILKLLKLKASKAELHYKFRVQRAGCLDRCELGPVQVAYPEGEWFRLRTEEDVDLFLENFLKNKNPDALARLRIEEHES